MIFSVCGYILIASKSGQEELKSGKGLISSNPFHFPDYFFLAIQHL